MKFTTRGVENLQLPPDKTDHVEWDDDVAGFGLRLRRGGARSWIYRYRLGTKQRSLKLGNATAVPLTVARANAAQLEARVRLGEDPSRDIENAKREAGETFATLAEQYLEARRPEWRPKALKEARRHLLKDARPLHELPVTAITQRDVATLLNASVRTLPLALSPVLVGATVATNSVAALRPKIKLFRI
jgi:hypothetical protein